MQKKDKNTVYYACLVILQHPDFCQTGVLRPYDSWFNLVSCVETLSIAYLAKTCFSFNDCGSGCDILGFNVLDYSLI